MQWYIVILLVQKVRQLLSYIACSLKSLVYFRVFILKLVHIINYQAKYYFLLAGKTMQRGRLYSKVEKNSPMLARFLKWRLLMAVISAITMVDFLYHDFRTYPPITEQLSFDSEMYRNAQNKTLNKL